MRRTNVRIVLPFLAAALLATSVGAQVDDYKIERYVIANGGGNSASAGTEVTGTSGQQAAGTRMTGGNFVLDSGFWSPTAAAATASSVAVSGRVTTSSGRAIRGGTVKLTDEQGAVRSVATTPGGYFRFEDVEAGRMYIVTAASGRLQFEPSVIVVTDEVTGLSLVGR